MPPASGPTLTTVPGPALGAHPPQGPCCFHWLCSPYAPCSEGAGPTSPQWTASSPPFVAHHRAAHTQGRGPGNFQQEQKFAICLACIWNPPWARFLALPLFPSYCPLASRAGFSLGQARHRLHRFPKHLIFLPNIFSRPCNLHGTFQI